MKPIGIICLDGGDCTGKSVLAKHFADKYEAKIFHATYRFKNAMPIYHEALRRRAERVASAGGLAILDRHFLTEALYARVFRGGTRWPEYTFEMDAKFRKMGVLTILCLPNTIEESLKRKRERLDSADLEREKPVNDGKVYDDRQIVELFSRYLDLWRGNMFCEGDDLAAELTRTGGVCDRPDFMRYRIEVEGQDVATFAKIAIEKMRGLCGYSTGRAS